MLTSRTFAVNHTPPRRRTPETTLYAPVKRYLEALGFTVKGEVCGCDLVALRGEEPPIVVIGELKLAFSLELVLQGVDRTAACGEVWLAVRVAGRGGPSPARPTLSAPPSRPTVTPNDTRRRVSAKHEIAAAIAAAREPVGVRGKRSREHR